MKFKDFLVGAAVAPFVAPALPFLGAAALLKKDEKPAPPPQQPQPAPVYNITIINNNGAPSQIGLDEAKPQAQEPGTSPGLASPESQPAASAAAAQGRQDFRGILDALTKLLASLQDLLRKLVPAEAAA